MSGARKVAGVGLTVVSLLLLVFAYSSPWYHLTAMLTSTSGEEIADYEEKFYLHGWSVEMMGLPGTYEYDYDEDPGQWSSMGEVMTVEFMMLLASAALSVVAVFSVLIGRRALSLGACGLAAALLFVAAMYFFAMVPAAMRESSLGDTGVIELAGFWGEDEFLAVTFVWGPMVGWYLVIAAAILESIALSLISSQSHKCPPFL